MELRHLRYFVAVAETRHFGRAAENLHMAQPPLSQAIRQLEADLGVELFTRTTRQVALTGAGEVFRTDALRILQSVDEATTRVRRFAKGAEGILRLGLTGTACYRQLPEIARLVKEEMPGVALEIQTELLTPAQELALTENRLDVGMLRPPVRQEGIVCREVAREPLVLAVPEDHWLSDAESAEVAQLRHENFIMYAVNSRSVVNDAVTRSCLAAGYYPHCAHDVTETSTALALVAAGLGIALLPDSVRSVSRDGVVFKPVRDAETVGLALAWRENDASPLLETLIGVLESHDVFEAAAPIEDSHENHRS